MSNISWFLAGKVDVIDYRIICFPYAGGSPSTYMHWQSRVPKNIQIVAAQFPGRGTHTGSKSINYMPDLLEQLAIAINPFLDCPVVFFGHSLGAVIAFELARILQSNRKLIHLFASGCMAPKYWPPEKGKLIASLGEEEFIAAMHANSILPKEVFEQEKLLKYFLPIVRADYALVAGYQFIPSDQLTIPLTVLVGCNDEQVPLDKVTAWKEVSCKLTKFKYFSGGHFFINEQTDHILDIITDQLLTVDVSMK